MAQDVGFVGQAAEGFDHVLGLFGHVLRAGAFVLDEVRRALGAFAEFAQFDEGHARVRLDCEEDFAGGLGAGSLFVGLAGDAKGVVQSEMKDMNREGRRVVLAYRIATTCDTASACETAASFNHRVSFASNAGIAGVALWDDGPISAR